MAQVVLIQFDDEVARRWEPFALTRPAGELLFGTMTFRERAERVLRTRCAGHIAAEHLADFDEPGAPPVLRIEDIATDQPRIFLLARFAPGWGTRGALIDRGEGPISTTDGDVIGWFSPAGSPNPTASFLLHPETAGSGTGTAVQGTLVERVWHLIGRNPEQVARDIAAIFPPPVGTKLPPGAFHWGGHSLIVDSSAVIEPGSAFDTSKGPIWLDRDAEVRAFTRLSGPAYVGPGSVVLGGSVEAASIGPMCRVRGEFAESVCIGYVNKQHDGHIGHAYLGRWVNLGAGTTNSDLKNNYSTVRIWSADGEVDTGELKLGSLIGDHVKTGIGLLLNTGTVIGAGCNLYGNEMPPTYVPPFSWGTGAELVEFRLDKFLQVAAVAMARRGVTLSDAARRQLERAWQRARASRQAANRGDAG